MKPLTPKERSRTPEGEAWMEAHDPFDHHSTDSEREAAGQVPGWPLCPRCEAPLEPWGGALSRMDNATEICSNCGQAEGLRDFARAAPIPPDEWPVEKEEEIL